ncbi:Sec34-like family-domain-containing protein [Mycena galericulata]|nr:Sec34-like family-domain-containing protein [Mycena galericulata]
MSARQTQRRGTTPALHTPPPKPTLNVEEWESKAPLTDREISSVGVLKAASESAPLPYKFEDDSNANSRPSTPLARRLGPNVAAGGPSRPGTPLPPSSAARFTQTQTQTHALHPAHPVHTAQQFYDWFALVERAAAHSQEAHFRAHGASVAAHLATCDALAGRVDEVREAVEGMLEGWRGVEEGGRSLKDACERLLEERDRLLEMTDEIGARLEYFQELDAATRMLNHPGESLVLQTDFLYMVERVDICIDYLRAHRHFRESDLYLLRFQQCLTRAMTLVRMYFVGSLRALAADVGKRVGEKTPSPALLPHLLYTRFRTFSTALVPLLRALESRVVGHAELGALLGECHSAYFGVRRGLVGGVVRGEVRGIGAAAGEDVVELTRAGCGYVRQLCADEFELYGAFFETGEEGLYAYLSSLCDHLFDDLRPRILHAARLETLGGVCTVLMGLMVGDAGFDSDSDSDSDSEAEREDSDYERGERDQYPERRDNLNLDLDHPPPKSKTSKTTKTKRTRSAPHPLGRLQLARLLEPVLHDAQTRLIFKAQAVLQAEVRGYVPGGAGAGAGGAKVQGGWGDEALGWHDWVLRGGVEDGSGNGNGEGNEMQETWYPTLRKTVWVLAQLRDYVNPAIFEDIAQEAVTLCRQSLVGAADVIPTRDADTRALDAELFLVRHLLILKEIAQGLDLGQESLRAREGEAFQYGVADTLATMLNRTTALLPGALFASLGMPRGGEEGIRDAKHGIDHELKRACEGVIAECALPICAPLRAWVEQIDAHNARRASASAGGAYGDEKTKANANAEGAPLTTQAAFTQGAAEGLDAAFRAACETELRARAGRVRRYLGFGAAAGGVESGTETEKRAGPGTAGVLLQHVRDQIAGEYALFREVVWNMYAGGMRAGVLSTTGVRELLEGVCAGVKGEPKTG